MHRIIAIDIYDPMRWLIPQMQHYLDTYCVSNPHDYTAHDLSLNYIIKTLDDVRVCLFSRLWPIRHINGNTAYTSALCVSAEVDMDLRQDLFLKSGLLTPYITESCHIEISCLYDSLFLEITDATPSDDIIPISRPHRHHPTQAYLCVTEYV